jgi:hypothetical protein
MFGPDPNCGVAGVRGTVFCVKASDGTPVFTIDEGGNVGVFGKILAPNTNSNVATQSKVSLEHEALAEPSEIAL